MIGPCRLCLEEKELIKRSHIIPNFMYKELVDHKNRMILMSLEAGQIERSGFRQSGEFDSDILCADCDNTRLGKLDRYASLVLYDGYEKSFSGATYQEGCATFVVE